MRACNSKTVKFSHIRYRALDRSWSRCTGSQPAGDYAIHPAVGCHYFPPCLRVTSSAFTRCRHPYVVARIRSQLTTHLSTLKGWKAELACSSTCRKRLIYQCEVLYCCVDRVTKWREREETKTMRGCCESISSLPVMVTRVPPAWGPNSGRTLLMPRPTSVQQHST